MVLILALEASSILAVVGGALLILAHPPVDGWTDFLRMLVGAGGLSLSFLLAFLCAGLYDLRIMRSFDAFLERVPRALAAAVLLVVLVSTLIPAARILGDTVVSSLLLTVGVVFGPLVSLRAIAARIMRRPFGERVLIVGTSPLACQLIDEINARPQLHYSILGVVDDGGASSGLVRYPILGPLERLGRIFEGVRPDRIIVALAERRGRLPVGQLLEAQVRGGVVLEDGAEAYERLTGKLALESLRPSSLVFSRDFRKSRLTGVVARAISLLASIIGLIGFAPLFGLIALAIKLDSRGPVFFVQERVGKYGKRFRLIKFRTMHPANEHRSEWVRDNGDRITRVGKRLRRFRLDELPQLVNIIRGDMNLVGPRPHPVSNFELFVLVTRNLNDMTGEKTPYYTLRCAVRPGLTGWAQVRYGYANDLGEETEKMRYDLYYIKHRSFWLDLRILVETLKIVLRGETAPTASPIEAQGRTRVVWEAPPSIRAGTRTAALAGAGSSDGPENSWLDSQPSGH